MNNKLFCRTYMLGIIAILALQDCYSQAHTKNDLDPFLLLIETTSDGLIKVSCKEGCGFIWINYKPRRNQPQGFDQRGMKPDISQMKTSEDRFANYYFTITLMNNELYLEGMEGTSWSELTITCNDGNCYQYINQDGLVVKSIE